VIDLAEASASCPVAPGVYYLLAGRRLQYVGTASNLRRRLAEHRRSGRWTRITSVRWELFASPASALARETAVLVALRPPRNRAPVDDYFAFVQRGRRGGLVLAADGEYGCFPHLGRGALSAPGGACIDGFDALARLVRAVPPTDDDLDAFLTGESDRLLATALDEDQPHVRLGIERDRAVARRFYEAGPVALATLRRRHGATGAVTRAQWIAWIKSEVRELLRAP
jgi:hypothetical protein